MLRWSGSTLGFLPVCSTFLATALRLAGRLLQGRPVVETYPSIRDCSLRGFTVAADVGNATAASN